MIGRVLITFLLLAAGGAAAAEDGGTLATVASTGVGADTIPTARPDTLPLLRFEPITAPRLDTLPDPVDPRRRSILPAIGDRDGDLAWRVRALGEFGGDWTRFRPCDASFQVTCRPGLFPQLDPDVLLGVEARGSVAERIFVDVDYDQTREFTGANRFRVYYQGQEGELLQRVEVGDITFALPETRFLTRSVPAGNFGVLARGQAGGVELQTVFAQQQGARQSREFRLGGIEGETGIIQEDTVVVDDAEYVRRQFFFLVDPDELPGSPHVDIQSLRAGSAGPAIAPGPEPIQLYRMERDPIRQQQIEGYIQADAEIEGESGIVRESGWFRHLREGVDYYLHPSGLWVALRTPLRPDEALAVAYVNERGDSIGAYNPEAAAVRGEIPRLRLVTASQAQHQPGRATWDHEMKQVYRISGSNEVDRGAVRLTISLGEESGGRTFKEAPDGRRIPLLRLFGLDEDPPTDRVDVRTLFQPAVELFEERERGIEGTFLIFPTLRPFARPPPSRAENLDADAAFAVLAPNANPRIYDAPDPVEREASALYRLNLDVSIRSAGLTSSISLGAFGIREGSERVFLGERLLQPEIDYLIDYTGGTITLLQPEALLARSSSDRLQVSWEEAAVFRTSPTSILGMSASVPVGDEGAVDLMGLYQVEGETVNRPRFGAEPGALGMIGVRSRLDYGVPALDAFLERLPGARTDTPSRFRMDGEIAVSLPDPNVSGDAYLDDFDAGEERPLSLLSRDWHLGSRPEFRDGAETALPATLDEETAASLAWQHTWIEEGIRGDSIGVAEGFLSQEQIDRQINFAGSQTRENVLRLTFGDQDRWSGFEGARWRSLTTLLSPTGMDLTHTEYLDFYVAEGDSLTLVVDLGLVSEDAFFVDEEGRTSGTRGAEPWGLGTLDQEADPLQGEIWGALADEEGLWAEDCEAEPGRVYRAGDPRANCTRGNGRRDTEDLNRNGILDTTERYRRYVVTLDGSSPYLVRNRPQTGTRFRLYRIPLRDPGGINPGGAFTEADWRSVQFLRITAAGPREESLTLARMRLVGSRWVKRTADGVLRGIAGDTASLAGSLEVSPVSTLTEGAAYRAPPGVVDEVDDPAAAVGGQGVEFNEKSLALRYRDVGPGDRAEVYHRFLQRPRNFLSYTTLRVWSVARSGSPGSGAPTDFFLKVGSDPENFYLYRAPMEPAANPEQIAPADWLPEHRIHFDEWTELRRRAEEEILARPPGPGDPPVVVWSADSTHAVVLRDRARAPNLAAVREISVGAWNRGEVPIDGELWINELRLGGGARAGGGARVVNVELDGGDLFQARAGYTGQGPDFRQMHEMASFQTDGALSFGGTVQAGRFLPEEWAMEVPVSVSHQRTSRDPFFLAGTDLRADLLPNLRAPGFSETRVGLAFGASGRTGRDWLDRILPGTDFRFALHRSSGTTVTSETAVRGAEAFLGYTWRPEERTVGLLPEFLEPIARIFLPPSWLRRLQEARLRWTPEELGAGSGLRQRDLTTTRFDQILADPGAGDAGFTEVTSEAWLENDLRLALRPFEELTADLRVRSTRDVLGASQMRYDDPRILSAIERERRSLLGRNLGWETDRVVEGRFEYRPGLPPWLRADLGLHTRYRTDRNAGLVRLLPDGDPLLLRNAGAERDLRANFTLDPGGLPGVAAGEGEEGFGSRLARALSPVTVGIQDGVTSWFYREAVGPGARYQLGLGGGGLFSSIDGVAATSLVDRSGLDAGSGIRIGDGPFLQVNYRDTEVASLDRRAERRNRNRSWPDLRAGVGTLPVPEGWEEVLTRVSFSSGWQRVTEQVDYGEAALQRRSRDELRVPLELVLEWAPGISTRYRGLLGEGEGRDPTGNTERTLREHGVSVETRLVPRGGLTERIREPLRLSLVLSWSELTECRITTASEGCVPFVDHLDRGVELAVGTLVSDFEVGGQLSLLDRRSFTGMRAGHTQFRLGIWVRMVLEAGPLELLQPPEEPF